uniref:Uncharacterized protein n=1 Tax=Dunaliella tertiolecta TaxID=3047 RepID=A0A6S8IDZ4_DUNTE
MLQASLGASIVSLGALLSVARRVRRKDHSLHSSSTASSTAGLGSSQCATLWLRSLCGDPASSSSWLTEQQQPALLVFHAEGQQLARVAGPPSAPNTGHACKHELVMGACEAASSLEAALTSSDGDPLLLPLDALFCATAVHVEEQQPCLVFASMWAGSKVLTASKEPGHHPTLKPFTGSNAQKWTLDDSGEIVNARWPDRALGMSGQRVQATRTADALQHDRASCTKIQELEYNLEVMEEQHSCLVDALEAEHQEQLQGLQQQCELEQRKSRGQEEKLEGLAGLVGQLQSRLGREQAASRHASEQLQQERARVTAVEEQLEAAHAQLRMLAGQAAQKQQEAAGAKAALVAAHERQLAALQQQRQEALLESTRLRQEVEQMRKDLASMTSAKDEAFRFLETVRAQTHQKDQVNEALLDKCCTLDATLQAINSKIGIICNERRTEPLQRSLQAADLGRLRRRLDQIKDSCNSSAFASPVLALPETRGHRSPFVLQLPHGADESQNAEGMGSNSRR